jgi:predicted dehydrogenase
VQARTRWLVLGTGFISGTIVQAINKSETGTVVAVAARYPEKTRKFADDYAIPNFSTNLDEMITAKYVDAVYIALPNHLHAEYTIKAVQSGKHVLCEKPFTTSIADAKSIIAQVDAAGVICMEALMYRCHPLTQKLISLVDADAIGQIKSFHATYIADIPPNKIEGGALRNLGCYPISLIRLLAKTEPVTVAAIGTLCLEEKPSDTYTNIIMDFANDSHAYITILDKGQMKWNFEMKGTKGSIRLETNPWLPNEGENTIAITSPRSSLGWEKLIVKADKPLYTYQIDAIGKAIAGDSSQLISLQDSLANISVIETCRKMVMERSSQVRLGDANSDTITNKHKMGIV